MKSALALALGRLWRSTTEAFRDSRRSNALRREFEKLDAAALQDCGFSRSELAAAFRNQLPWVDLLSPAMLALGLNPAKFVVKHPGRSRDLGRACRFCQYRRRCRDDIAAQRFSTRYRKYCLNSDSFDEISREYPHVEVQDRSRVREDMINKAVRH